jgi:hypothetical protein
MGTIVVVLLIALVLSAAVMLYAAYPYRGEETPLTPRLGEVMRRGVESLPTLGLEHQDRPALSSAQSPGQSLGQSPGQGPGQSPAGRRPTADAGADSRR